jgi:hypothetical protein
LLAFFKYNQFAFYGQISHKSELYSTSKILLSLTQDKPSNPVLLSKKLEFFVHDMAYVKDLDRMGGRFQMYQHS